MVVKVNRATSYCKYKNCPGLNSAAKRPRTYKSKYVCEQCTMEKGPNFWLCNSAEEVAKEVDGILEAVDCHTAYHVDMNLYVVYTTTAPPPGITTECGVVSDLRQDPLSTCMLDMYFSKKEYNSSLLLREILCLKHDQIKPHLNQLLY